MTASAQELDELLAQPLQAAFSRRFFTGVPSASLAAKPAAEPSGGAQPQAAGSAAVEDAQAGAKVAAGAATDSIPDESQAAQQEQQQQQQREREQGLKQTVALAQNLASSRQRTKVREVPSCCSNAVVPGCRLLFLSSTCMTPWLKAVPHN